MVRRKNIFLYYIKTNPIVDGPEYHKLKYHQNIIEKCVHRMVYGDKNLVVFAVFVAA